MNIMNNSSIPPLSWHNHHTVSIINLHAHGMGEARLNHTSFDDENVSAFLSDPSMGLDVSQSLQDCADLTDVTLIDEDSNSMPTDDVNRAILGNVAMQAKSTWWPNLKLMQVAPLVGQTSN